MAFVQVTKVPDGLTGEQYDRIIMAAYGGKLTQGETFRVAGPSKDGVWYVIDGWRTREECDASGAKLMPALQAEGLSMSSMTVEEFDIHAFEAAKAVS